MPPSKRDDLIDAAMTVFYRHGFHSCGLDKVLQEGGISRMTLYNHFKSKDELIIAALRRRDEIFRNRMMKFVDSASSDPIERLLAIFDYHEQWFTGKEFCGCMFINASAEYSDPNSPVRRIASNHKRDVIRYLVELCQQAGLANPGTIAEELNILIEGSIVNAQVVGQVGENGANPGDSAIRAKGMAQRIIDSTPRT